MKIIRKIAWGVAIFVCFLIGMVDRVILIFLPWIEIPSLFKAVYYERYVIYSIKRVAAAGLLYCLFKIVSPLLKLYYSS